MGSSKQTRVFQSNNKVFKSVFKTEIKFSNQKSSAKSICFQITYASTPCDGPLGSEHTVRPITNSLASPEHVSDVNTESRSGIKPKLPKLQLPKFAGDITKFRTFWDSFNSAIHCNNELSAIDKFNYLKALLEGPAAQAIQGLTLSKANYTAAIELIK